MRRELETLLGKQFKNHSTSFACYISYQLYLKSHLISQSIGISEEIHDFKVKNLAAFQLQPSCYSPTCYLEKQLLTEADKPAYCILWPLLQLHLH